MSVVRVVFMGTPEFAVPSLKTLIADEHFEVVLVVSQPDRPAGRKRKLTPSPVKLCAQENGIEVLTPERVREPEVLEKIRSFQADAAVVVAFGQILPQEFIDMFTYGPVNIHSSLLPRWRGAAPMQRGLIAGDTEGGITLQKIVKELDAGDVLGVRKIELDEKINAIELHDRLAQESCDLLAVDFMDFCRGNLSGVPQDPSGVTTAPKIKKEEAEIDWLRSATDLHNLVRGLAMGPQTWSCIDGKKVKIHRTEVVEGKGSPGEVLESESCLVVACGQGALSILEIQPESKGKMKVGDYLRGYPVGVGRVFPD